MNLQLLYVGLKIYPRDSLCIMFFFTHWFLGAPTDQWKWIPCIVLFRFVSNLCWSCLVFLLWSKQYALCVLTIGIRYLYLYLYNWIIVLSWNRKNEINNSYICKYFLSEDTVHTPYHMGSGVSVSVMSFWRVSMWEHQVDRMRTGGIDWLHKLPSSNCLFTGQKSPTQLGPMNLRLPRSLSSTGKIF